MNTTYTQPTERSAKIRKELKALGITAKMVSVRTSTYSMGASISVTLLDPSVSLNKVKAVTDGHETIRRDHLTGDILSGGNCFIMVQYSQGAYDSMIEEWTATAEQLISRLDMNAYSEISVPGHDIYVSYDGPHFLSINAAGHTTFSIEADVRGLARQIGFLASNPAN